MPKVLLTSFGHFGPLAPHQTNPSHLISTRLPTTLTTPSSTDLITLILPPEPLQAAYHAILAAVPKLIQEHDPDIIIHMGYAEDQPYFSVEKSAAKEGYHEIPDVARKVFTRADTKRIFGRAPERLGTGVDVDAVVEAVINGVRREGQAGKKGKGGGGAGEKAGPVDVRATDDVGNFVCGFIYYLSLWEMEKRGKGRNVVFLHCPLLEGEEQVKVGVRVAEELVKALVEQMG